MKNILVGLIALPVIALALWLLYLAANIIFAGVAIAIGVIASFGPIILGGILSIGVIIGVIYFIGAVVRGIKDDGEA